MKYRRRYQSRSAFSLVEVVLALGVISFAIVAILGVLPIGLQTGRSAQDETRASQIAGNVLSPLAGQARDVTNPNLMNSAAILRPIIDATVDPPLPNSSYNVDLTAPQTYNFAADNDGNLVRINVDPTQTPSSAKAFQFPFQVQMMVQPDPTGFDTGCATKVTIRVISPPSATATLGPNQSVRDFVRIVSRF